MRTESSWRSALIWGIGAAVIHRLVIQVWLAAVWLAVGLQSPVAQPASESRLPLLESRVEQLVFGVWRRWDAMMYLSLAKNGYQLEDIGPTVFAPLAPVGIWLSDQIVPGPLDLGALVFSTAAFALALVLLYRLCQVYYKNEELAPWAVTITALLPLSYFFQTPIGEAIYLAMALALFYAGTQQRWGWAALFGLLATLARAQGVLLLPVAVVLLFERRWSLPMTWRERLLDALRRGWPLLVIPLGLVGFEFFRRSQGFPSMTEVYRNYSYSFFTNPIEGLIINLRWIVEHPFQAAVATDPWGLMISLCLGLALLRSHSHGKPALISYASVHLLLFVSTIAYLWGTDQVTFSLSTARRSIVLFPLTVLFADWLRQRPPRQRLIGIGALSSGFLVFSALSLFYLTAP